MSLIPTPSQTVGPYFSLGMAWLTTTDLAKDASVGERIVIAGSVLDGDGQPIPDAVLEVWQANASGKYAHPEDTQERPVDPGFSGFGRIPTDKDGRFRFVTIKPGATTGPGNTLQAPHILVALFMRGLGKQLYTRIYFSGEPANATDPLLGRIAEPARRETLMASRIAGSDEYRWDIRMQGEHETVFFDC
ncbi:MAG TPA: protocatechuate 3,4-dioxygenase subunit alpha [Gemmatimonadales bacterium]|nr:protocatechuate 3,4-dioxygenase subunit alpha [Gemmatimonadales bacterium]